MQRLLGDERRFSLFHRSLTIRSRTRLWTLPPTAQDRNKELPFVCDFPLCGGSSAASSMPSSSSPPSLSPGADPGRKEEEHDAALDRWFRP
jgi:hypothetical protein